MINTVAGVLCDGAKPGCALKISSALGTAVDFGRMAASGALDPGIAGLAGMDGNEAFDRLSKLVGTGYAAMDLPIVALLAKGQSSAFSDETGDASQRS